MLRNYYKNAAKVSIGRRDMEQSKSLLDAGLISGAAAAFMGYVPDIAAVLAVILLLFRIANEAINLIRQRARMRYYKEKQNAEADD